MARVGRRPTQDRQDSRYIVYSLETVPFSIFPSKSSRGSKNSGGSVTAVRCGLVLSFLFVDASLDWTPGRQFRPLSHLFHRILFSNLHNMAMVRQRPIC